MTTFHEVQARAEPVAQALGVPSPGRPLDGESVTQFHRRTLTNFQHFSERWRLINLSTTPDAVLNIAADAIYADAMAEARNPNILLRPGELKEIKTMDAAGRPISRFYGDPEVTWSPFKSVRRRIIGFGGR